MAARGAGRGRAGAPRGGAVPRLRAAPRLQLPAGSALRGPPSAAAASVPPGAGRRQAWGLRVAQARDPAVDGGSAAGKRRVALNRREAAARYGDPRPRVLGAPGAAARDLPRAARGAAGRAGAAAGRRGG